MKVVVVKPNGLKQADGSFLEVGSEVDCDASTAKFWKARGWVADIESGSPTSEVETVAAVAAEESSDPPLDPGKMFSDAVPLEEDPED